MVAVRQKVQPMAHPSCEETQIDLRSSVGMRTVSKKWPSWVSNTHLVVPSVETWLVLSLSTEQAAEASNASWRVLGRLDILRKSDSRLRNIQLRIWRARKPGSPSETTKASRSCRDNPRM